MLRLPEWYASLLHALPGGGMLSTGRHLEAVAYLQKLQRHFYDAEGRDRAKAYARNPALRDAYLLYYSTANLLKLMPVLDELTAGGQLPGNRAPVVVDLGCGPGTGLLALVHWLQLRDGIAQGLTYIGLDHARENLVRVQDCAAWLRAELGLPGLEVETFHSPLRDIPELPERADLLMAMNVLNECGDAEEAALLEEYRPLLRENGTLLIMEPALRESSRRLLTLRDAAVMKGWTVYGPCLRQGACPALARDTDWCHHDVPWDRPGWMAELDAELGNVKLSLKFSYVLLNRHGDTLRSVFGHAGTERMVSELFREKGRFTALFCGEEGRRKFQLNKRDITGDNRVFRELRRYDCIRVAGEERRQHDVRIGPETSLELLCTERETILPVRSMESSAEEASDEAYGRE